MATSQTNNYYLNQWISTDPVLRTDFNTDNYKIDSALNYHSNRLSKLEIKTNSLTNDAYTIQKPPIVMGTYTGNGAQSQSISLGFQPKAVLALRSNLTPNSDHFFANGLALYGVDSATGTEITSDGFTVHYIDDGNTIRATNEKGVLYIYFAVK